jgi:hypothetical protein
LPFGASPPEKKHHYAVVLHVTGDGVQCYSVDNFVVRPHVLAVGKDISAGNYLEQTTPTKWSGTHFEPMTPEEQNQFRDSSQTIPAGPAYDNVGGWSRRTVGGEVVGRSPTAYTESNAEVTIALDGKPLTFTMNSGFISHEAFIDLSHPGHAPERIWQLDENARRVSAETYNTLFGSDRISENR